MNRATEKRRRVAEVPKEMLPIAYISVNILVKVAKSKRSQTSAWARTLGQKVKERRLLFGLTQQELADTAGCSRVFVVQIENGKPTARLDSLVGLLQTLGLQFRIENGSEGIV